MALQQGKKRGVLAFPEAGLEQAIEELENSCGLHKNDEIKKLITKMKYIIAVLKDAEKKPISSDVHRFWLGELKQVAFDAEDLIDEFATDAAVQSMGAHINNIPTMTPRMMGQICEMNDRLDRLEPQISMLAHQISTIQDSCPGLTTWRQTSSLLPDETSVIGRDAEKEYIIKIMLNQFGESSSGSNEGLSIVPVLGLGGMGKTTLAQLVFNDERVQKHFELMMWVCVSNDFDPVRLTKDIIEAALVSKGMYERCKITNWDSVQRRLRQEVEGKTFLLVLDDVWAVEQSVWKKLLIPLHFGKKGSKVLVTARNRAFVDKLEGRMETPIFLGGLSDADIWVVFKKYAFRGNVKADGTTSAECSHLEDLGRCIVERLEGSPLAARTIGSLLNHDLDVQHWKAVLESEFWTLEQGEDDILPALQLSYEYLSADLKQCFAYCSLFPKGHEFSREQLVELWEAESFIRKGRGTRMETMGSKYFDELLHMSFFGRIECSCYAHENAHVMHDLIHDLAEYVSKDDYFRLEDQSIVKIPNTVRHMSVCVIRMDRIDMINKLCCYEKLRTLLFPTSYYYNLNTHDLDQLFLKLKMLRVLGLGRCCISELPGSIGDLNHLRYIDLQGNYELENLPESLGNLYNLQVLNLSFCRIRELPGSIGDLKHLRNLHLQGNVSLKNLPESLGNLCNLQVLNLGFCRIRKLPGSIGDLKHLRNLDLQWNDGPTRLPELLGNLYNLQVLKSSGSKIGWLPGSNGDLEQLRSINLQGNNAPLWLPESLGNLYNLQVLNLSGSKMGWLPGSIGDLKQLRSINLQGNNVLLWLPESLGNLYNLQVLNLYHCCSLRVLPSTMSRLVNLRHLLTGNYELVSRIDGLGKLTGLQELQVRGRRVRELGGMCMLRKLTVHNLEEVGFKQEAIQARLPGMECLQVLQLEWSKRWPLSIKPELEEEVLQALRPNRGIEELHIQGYGGTKSPDWMEVSTTTSFSSLRRVSLFNCPNWQVPPCSFLSQLRHLEYLQISRMPEWEGWGCPVSWECLLELKIQDCPRLKELPLLPRTLKSISLEGVGISRLPELGGCSRVEGEIETTSSPHSPPTVSASLSRLKISDCDNLTSISGLLQQLFPDLEEIEISNCKNLVSLPEKGFGHLVSLKRLWITECTKLTCLLQEEENASTQHLPCSLEELEIGQCGDAMGGWWWAGLQRLTSIAKLTLYGCPTTVELLFLSLGRQLHPHLPVTLRELWIDGSRCDNYERQPTTFSASPSRLSPPPTPPQIPHNVDASARALRAFTSLENLTICHSLNLLQKWGGCGLPSSLQRLTIVGDHYLDHNRLSVCLHDLISLKELTLQHLENLRLLPNLNALTSLETLDIETCPSMEVFEAMSLHTSLKSLTLRDCKNLRSLTNLSSLTSLETLLIRSCPSIQTFGLEVMSLPTSLNKLTLKDCKDLRSLPDLSSLSSLRNLKICYCPTIQSWPPSGLPSSLLSLKIYECPALIESFEGKSEFLCREVAHIPQVVINRITFPRTDIAQQGMESYMFG